MKAWVRGREVEIVVIPSNANAGDHLVKDGKITAVVPPDISRALYLSEEYIKFEEPKVYRAGRTQHSA